MFIFILSRMIGEENIFLYILNAREGNVSDYTASDKLREFITEIPRY